MLSQNLASVDDNDQLDRGSSTEHVSYLDAAESPSSQQNTIINSYVMANNIFRRDGSGSDLLPSPEEVATGIPTYWVGSISQSSGAVDPTGDVGSIDGQSSGFAPSGSANEIISKRTLQNRKAQREFRQRRATYLKELEEKVRRFESGQAETILALQREITQLRAENAHLQGLVNQNSQNRSQFQLVPASTFPQQRTGPLHMQSADRLSPFNAYGEPPAHGGATHMRQSAQRRESSSDSDRKIQTEFAQTGQTPSFVPTRSHSASIPHSNPNWTNHDDLHHVSMDERYSMAQSPASAPAIVQVNSPYEEKSSGASMWPQQSIWLPPQDQRHNHHPT